MPLITIIIPVYKVEAYLHQCVNSVLQQSFENFEIILVDDGSPDNCPSICDDFAGQDQRVRVIHKKNGGLSDARNFGIKEASGDYLLFLDSDDYWNDTEFLNKLVKKIGDTDKIDVISFGFMKYYPLSNHLVPDDRTFSIIKQIEESNVGYIKRLIENDLYIACAWNKCIKREFVLDNRLFFEKGLRSEDMAWCGDILYLMPDMECLNMRPYVYRQEREDSITSTVDINHLNDILGMIKKALKKSNNLNSEDKHYYLSFYAVQYLTLLFNLKVTKEKNSRALSQEVYNLRRILNNDLNPKVKKANQFMKIFSYSIMTRILRLYVLITKK